MLFHITVMLPGRNGQATQFVIAEVDVQDADELAETLREDGHIAVTEMNTDAVSKTLVKGDRIILNERYIAKIAPYRERRYG